jgi:tubulin polyglutamylase TTLL5
MIKLQRKRYRNKISKYMIITLFQYRRVQSAETLPQGRKNIDRSNKNETGLTSEQQRIVISAKAQFERRGGFVRIFPSPKSWELYSQYLGK